MKLTLDEKIFLQKRKEEIEREIRELGHAQHPQGPVYYEVDERRIELLDELETINSELRYSTQ